MPDNSEEIAQKTFMALEQHKAKIEETKASLLNYQAKYEDKQDFDVKDLLAQGEEMGHQVQGSETKKKKSKTAKDDSDSDMEDWEEVKGKYIYYLHAISILSILSHISRNCYKLFKALTNLQSYISK